MASPRIDRIQLRDGGQLTPEGYLDVDAYLARDGLLKYSDGLKSWLEYRPRAELEAAAESWAHKPVTDDHPPVMVDATNAREYRRGTVISVPTIVEADGVAYLAARIRIDDAALVSKIQGGQRELSIGFMADVKPEPGEVNGVRYDAVQRALAGNHVASVQRGRAGPAVRVMLDSAQVSVPVCYDAHVKSDREVSHVSKPKLDDARAPRTIKLPTGTRMDKLRAWTDHVQAQIKADEVGLPTTSAKLIGPDGTEVEVPTWVAALVAEALDARKSMEASEPAAPAEGEAAKPEPMAEGEAAPAKKPEDEKEPPMTPDQINALVRKRGRLERLAATAGVPSATIDASDDLALARAYVAHVLPHAKARADKAEGVALDELVEVAAATPRPAPAGNPFEVARKLDADKPEDDPIVQSYARGLVAAGMS